jgi:hypothetical protein
METTNGKGSKAVNSPKKVEAAEINPLSATISNGDQSEKEAALGKNENQDLTLKREETLSGDSTEKATSIVALDVSSTQGSGVMTQSDSQHFTFTQDETLLGEVTETPEEINGLEVISKQDGFRRAGLVWSKEATRIKFCEMTEQQYLALQAEPMLSIKPVTI